jgi:hypothetical protein
MANKKFIVEKLLEKGMDPRIEPTPQVPSPLQIAANLGPTGKELYGLLRGTSPLSPHLRFVRIKLTGRCVRVRCVRVMCVR